MSILDSSPVTSAMRRTVAKVLAAVVAVAAVALLAGCGGGGGGGATASAPAPASSPVSPASGSSITIDNFKFSPASSTVKRGARIDVSNDDSAPHTVTSDDGHSFDSGTLQPGGSTTITAPRTGRFPYHCTIHPFMKGVLVVK